MAVRWLCLGMGFSLAALGGCGDSSSGKDDGGAGQETRGGSGGSAGNAGSGGSSGSSTGGGVAGTTAGGSAGAAAGVNGGSSGTAAGANGGDAGTAGSSGGSGATGGWNATCGSVTLNGRCDGNVYEWCDYFTQGLKRLDCTPLGMTCRAMDWQPPETEVNGCVGGPCTASSPRCDGALALRCASGELVASDCAKSRGPGSMCELRGEEMTPACTSVTPCGDLSSSHCDGNLNVICTEDGTVYYQDCARCNTTGRCGADASSADCFPSFLDCQR